MEIIHVIGVGPGPLSYLPAEAKRLLASAPHLVADSGVRQDLELERKGRGLTVAEAGRDPGDIVDSLRHLAAEHAEIAFVVPQSDPTRHAVVRHLLAFKVTEVVLHVGPGELELAAAALGRPLETVLVIPGTDLEAGAIPTRFDLLILEPRPGDLGRLSALLGASKRPRRSVTVLGWDKGRPSSRRVGLTPRVEGAGGFDGEAEGAEGASGADGDAAAQEMESVFALYVPAPAPDGHSFDDLVEVMARLRGPEGCLWDRQQTNRSLARYLIEETYEVVDAIERDDKAHLSEELGDLLLQIVFHAEIAASEGAFDISDVIDGIVTKLVRRHPHIFAGTEVTSAEDVERNWEQIKRAEKAGKPEGGAGEIAGPGKAPSALAGVPASLPALLYAEKLQAKAARVGFDWEEYRQVIEKVKEELAEIVEAKETGGDVEHELGDVVFAVVNLARFLGSDSELALRGACTRFINRFRQMEELAAAAGQSFTELSLDGKERLWREAKKRQAFDG
ncbi:MAG: nucleoside triphosphate pyrophosphohydrolase [Actinobacteria bacterium]|nr:MAG: nucleoside triphosphate pyrophosphohydrolase [Actinomycetota bacterium]